MGYRWVAPAGDAPAPSPDPAGAATGFDAHLAAVDRAVGALDDLVCALEEGTVPASDVARAQERLDRLRAAVDRAADAATGATADR